MYLLGQAEDPAVAENAEQRRIAIQGTMLAGLLGIAVWAWARSRPKPTFRSGYPKIKKNSRRRNPGLVHRKYQAPAYRRRPLTGAERIAEARTNLELMRLGRVGPRHIARARTRLESLKRS